MVICSSRKSLVKKKDEEIRQLGTQMKSLVSSNREKANRLDEIKAELKELRTENKGLIERLDLMTRKLNIWRKKAKEHLPTAEFKGLSKKT